MTTSYLSRKLILVFITLFTVFVLSSCRGNSSPPTPEVQKTAEIIHKYTFSSSEPVALSLVATTGLDDIYINGENQKVPVVSGKEYKIDKTLSLEVKSKTEVLTSSFVLSCESDYETPAHVKMTWTSYINGEEVNSDSQEFSFGSSVASSKMYATSAK